jgi:LysM repeat protein
MRHWKRLFYYLIINVLVSACTVLAVLTIWERTHPEMPILSQVNPFAQITPMSPRALFPAYDTDEGPIEPTPESVDATELPGAPQATETPQAELEYIVQTGDTLGAIAVKFNITVAEIIAVNEIANPDALEVGQVLIILRPFVVVSTQTALPVEEIDAETEVATATLSSPPANTPPPLTGETRVIIDSVIGAGDLATERIYLDRIGSGEISLAGWQLVVESGEIFIFPQFTLFESGAVYIYTKSGPATAVTLYWELDHAVWESGKMVVLLDNQGEEHASYQIP